MLELNQLILTSITLIIISLFMFFYLLTSGSKQQVIGLKRELEIATKQQLDRLEHELVKIKKRTEPKECPHHLGYLSSHPAYISIPDECMGCTRITECYHHR